MFDHRLTQIDQELNTWNIMDRCFPAIIDPALHAFSLHPGQVLFSVTYAYFHGLLFIFEHKSPSLIVDTTQLDREIYIDSDVLFASNIAVVASHEKELPFDEHPRRRHYLAMPQETKHKDLIC